MAEQFEYTTKGVAITGGHAQSSLVHSSDTWQTWAFFFTAVLVLIFAVVDVLAIPTPWRVRFMVLGIKIPAFALTAYLMLINRTVRRWLLMFFERYVKLENVD
jgi:hypothetical protein